MVISSTEEPPPVSHHSRVADRRRSRVAADLAMDSSAWSPVSSPLVVPDSRVTIGERSSDIQPPTGGAARKRSAPGWRYRGAMGLLQGQWVVGDAR
jgi:hypothetical protein